MLSCSSCCSLLEQSVEDMEITATAKTYPSENGDDAEDSAFFDQKLSSSQVDPELEHLQSESHVKELTEMFTKVMSVSSSLAPVPSFTHLTSSSLADVQFRQTRARNRFILTSTIATMSSLWKTSRLTSKSLRVSQRSTQWHCRAASQRLLGSC